MHTQTTTMLPLDDFFKSPFTVDNIIFGFDQDDLKVLLIKRQEDPFLDKWALPGYFVKQDENLDDAAVRVLEELTGLKEVYLEQVATFGNINRHPSGRVITVAYYSLVAIQDYNVIPSNIASEAEWVKIKDITELSFDHLEILKSCFQRLKRKVRVEPIGFELLPTKFTLTDLQHLYEAILEVKLDKRNFRKKILSMDLLVDLDEVQEGVAHRPARLYKFYESKYQEFLAKGLVFDLSEGKSKQSKANRISDSEI